MEGMDMSMAMPRTEAWGPVELLMLFLMWVVMMIAMMIPSAAPMILLFASVNRKRKERDAPFVSTAVFASGYLLAWASFSALATLAQWGLHEAALLSPMMVSTSSRLGGGLLIAAGVFQMSLKEFVAALVFARSIRYFGEAWVAVRYGDQTVDFLKENAVVTIIGGLLLVGLFFAAHHWSTRRVTGEKKAA